MTEAGEERVSLAATLPAIGRLLRPYWTSCLVVGVCLLAEAGFFALVPLGFKFLIDEAMAKADVRVLTMVLTGLGVAAIAVSFIGLARDYLYARLAARVFADVRLELFDHMQRLCLKFWAKVDDGYVLSRFSSDLAAMEQAFLSAIPWAVLPGLDVAISTVLLFQLDWRLACVGMLVWPLALWGPRIFTPRATAASYRRRQDEADLLGFLQEHVVAHRLTKSFGLESLVRSRFQGRADQLVGSSVHLAFSSALVERTAGTGVALLQVLVLGVGAWMAFHGWITVGTLAAFQALFMSLGYSLSYVTQYVPSLVQAAGGLARLDEFYAHVPTVADAQGARVFEGELEAIAFEDVSFRHDDQGPGVAGLTFSVPRGTHVAFVGPSGSGKSTVLNLLMRFYEPDGGRITASGQDLRTLTQDSWRARIGMVPQEAMILNTSLRENIRLGRPEATDEEIEAVAREAGIHDAIMKMGGYDVLPGDRGERLSGGQRQRIAIARALLRDPAVLVLDEATSALDPATEVAIGETLERAARGKTVLAVTHRLDAVVGYDRIYVLEAGRLVEAGRHEELVAQGGVYARLWANRHGGAVGV